nr:MAG TPA: hypothetical protein [Caudoviricetes sp.]
MTSVSRRWLSLCSSHFVLLTPLPLKRVILTI